MALGGGASESSVSVEDDDVLLLLDEDVFDVLSVSRVVERDLVESREGGTNRPLEASRSTDAADEDSKFVLCS